MGMHVKKSLKLLAFLAFLVIFSGCDSMNLFLPSPSTYKLNARVSGTVIDDCSFVTINDKIQPFFEESVIDDPDITALLVFFRNTRGEVEGWKILYSLDGISESDEILIPVTSLDDSLPSVPIPSNFPVGRYTMVSQVMRGKEILQRTEKAFYYMGGTGFSYDGINVHLPGITENSQIIPRGMTVMLEAKIEFNSQIDPYIIWYNGRKKISEGRYSEGAGYLLWTAPEQSGFYSVTAEVFPSNNYSGLSGYQKEISLLVSTKTTDVHLVSSNVPQLVYWYTFEGNLNDSKLLISPLAAANPDRSLKPSSNSKPQWLSVNGVYGLAAGYDQSYSLPALANDNDVSGGNSWQTLFRFKPINDGGLFFIQFSPDVFLDVSLEGQYLILSLISPLRTVSQAVSLQGNTPFITAGISFNVLANLITARINITGDENGELKTDILRLDASVSDNFQIILGHQDENISSHGFSTAVWDEFALYNAPPIETILSDVKKAGESSASPVDFASLN